MALAPKLTVAVASFWPVMSIPIQSRVCADGMNGRPLCLVHMSQCILCFYLGNVAHSRKNGNIHCATVQNVLLLLYCLHGLETDGLS